MWAHQMTDAATFFHAKYVAHAAIVRSTPGATSLQGPADPFLALVAPVSGVQKVLKAF